jgi:uncharacterized protein YceK
MPVLSLLFAATLEVVSENTIEGLPEVRVRRSYWATATDWRFPPNHLSFVGDGLGLPLPFMFLADTIVVPYRTFIIERCLADGKLPGTVGLKVPGRPEALARMPDLKGWAWVTRTPRWQEGNDLCFTKSARCYPLRRCA